MRCKERRKNVSLKHFLCSSRTKYVEDPVLILLLIRYYVITEQIQIRQQPGGAGISNCSTCERINRGTVL
jgi:hypothetical protein